MALRVPFEAFLVIIGQVHEVANGYGVGSNINITDGTLAIADASEPIGFVIVAVVEVSDTAREVLMGNRFELRCRVRFLLGTDPKGKFATIDVEFAGRTVKPNPIASFLRGRTTLAR